MIFKVPWCQNPTAAKGVKLKQKTARPNFNIYCIFIHQKKSFTRLAKIVWDFLVFKGTRKKRFHGVFGACSKVPELDCRVMR